MENVEMKVLGMSCKSCVEKVEKALFALDGVSEVRITLAEDRADIAYDPEKVSEKKMKEAIEELGYLPQALGEERHEKAAPGKGETKRTVMKGIAYGLVPHIGCIGFLAASVLGVTFAAEFFRPLLMNSWFFYALIALSLLFATVSSTIYLMKNDLFSFKGMLKKKTYLGTMYGSTIIVSLLFLFVVFPMLANASAGAIVQDSTPSTGSTSAASAPQANAPLTTNTVADLQTLKISVQIPCTGHVPLILSELKKVGGIVGVKNSGGWNVFEVTYDGTKTSKETILGIEVFKSYPATVL